jgi:hypothetical protein
MTRWLGRTAVAVVAVVGLGADKPPGLPADPQVEGREPDPVARDFHRPEVVTSRYGTGSWAPPRATPARPGLMKAIAGEVWAVVLDRFTVPLGTVPVDGPGK